MDARNAYSSFAVDDLERAERFYRETLGIDARLEGEDPMRMLILHLGSGARVLVYPKPDHEPASFTVLNIPVSDVDAAVSELTAKGVTMNRYDGFDQDERGIARNEGPTIAWLDDPAGNTIAVLEETA